MKSIKRTRIAYLIIGMIAMLFLGMIYAWSNFTKYFEADLGWTPSQLSWVFTLMMIGFCIGNLGSGFMMRKISARATIFIGGALLGTGFVIVSFVQSYVVMLLAYGILGGVGMGMAYNAVLSSMVRWFPDRPGIASGMLLMALGVSALTVGSGAVAIIEANAGAWRGVFLGLGIAFYVILFTAGMVIKHPPAEMQMPTNPQYVDIVERDMKQFARSRFFRLCYIASILVSASSLAIIGRASQLATGIGADLTTATLFVGILSISNGVMRLLFGLVLDARGPRFAVILGPFCGVISLLLILGATLLKSLPMLLIAYLLFGCMYGGAGVAVGGTVVRMFGSKTYAINMPLLQTNLIVAAIIGPQLMSLMYNDGNGYVTALIVLLLMTVVCLILSCFQVTRAEDRQLRRKEHVQKETQEAAAAEAAAEEAIAAETAAEEIVTEETEA